MSENSVLSLLIHNIISDIVLLEMNYLSMSVLSPRQQNQMLNAKFLPLAFLPTFPFRCIMDGKYQQAMGIAIECRKLDKLEEAIIKSDNVQRTLSYCINVSHSYVNLREYRCEVRLCSFTHVL